MAELEYYPRIRLDRGDPVVTEAQEALGLAGSMPQSRIWAFAIEANAGTRTTAVSPGFKGPALLYEFMYRQAGAATGVGGLAMTWDTSDGGGQTNGLASILPTGTRLFESGSFRWSTVTPSDPIPERIEQIAPGTDISLPVIIRPRKLIQTLDRFFLKVSTAGGAAGSFHIRGVVVVVEGDSIESLRNFS